jgi:hypothetical protein
MQHKFDEMRTRKRSYQPKKAKEDMKAKKVKKTKKAEKTETRNETAETEAKELYRGDGEDLEEQMERDALLQMSKEVLGYDTLVPQVCGLLSCGWCASKGGHKGEY